MKTISIAFLAGIAGCAFLQPVAAAEAAKVAEKVLYSFAGPPDGQNPYAGVIDVNGTLYGTTYAGGDNSGFGSVFALDVKSGKETLLESFNNNPEGGLVDVKGTLYGTTSGGRTQYKGTAFSIDLKTGKEKTVYTFCSKGGCADGESPGATLIDVKGKLYGTTVYGGQGGCSGGCGTVFSLDPGTGAEKALYSFKGGTDGNWPTGSLIAVNGVLYGGATYGGLSGCGGLGCGTLFSVDAKTGAETVLYSFCSQANCADGGTPFAGLIAVNGTLYGMTVYGGITNCTLGCGTLFSLDPGTGAYKVLYSFCSQKNCTDGSNPEASLVDVNGILYGTTTQGGSGSGCTLGACGTVFAFDPATGAETVLHSFAGGKDGQFPGAGLIARKGSLYGTTIYGGNGAGCGDLGCGTVFVVKK